MERHLRNLDVWAWEYLENTRNYPGAHLTANPAACAVIQDCLATLLREGAGSRRTVPLRPLAPSDEAKVSGGQRHRAFLTVRLEFVESSPSLRRLLVKRSPPQLLIRLTPLSLPWLHRGLKDVAAGIGDYTIGPEAKDTVGTGPLDEASDELWVWPCFGHTCIID